MLLLVFDATLKTYSHEEIKENTFYQDIFPRGFYNMKFRVATYSTTYKNKSKDIVGINKKAHSQGVCRKSVVLDKLICNTNLQSENEE